MFIILRVVNHTNVHGKKYVSAHHDFSSTICDSEDAEVTQVSING